MGDHIAVIGATGRLGRKLVERLHNRGLSVIAVGRSADRLAGLPAIGRCADLSDEAALRAALDSASSVVSCVHARFARTILAALPIEFDRVVLVGSTRRFTRFPDSAAQEVADAEAALERSGRCGVIIHPTMIYGADNENNVQRVAAYIRRFGILPVPWGVDALVQPIYADDVVACLEAALFHPHAPGPPIVVAGPEPVPYTRFIEAIAEAIRHRVRIVRMPYGLLLGIAMATSFLPNVPNIAADEIRRLLEDKSFSISEMRQRLGIEPIGLAAGLERTFSTPPSTKPSGSEFAQSGSY